MASAASWRCRRSFHSAVAVRSIAQAASPSLPSPRIPPAAGPEIADLEQLVLAVCDFFSHFDGRCWQIPRQYGVLIEREIKACLAEILLDWARNVKGDHEPERATAVLVASMAGWTIYGAVLHWSHQQPRQPEAAFARAVLPLIPGNLADVSFQGGSGAERSG